MNKEIMQVLKSFDQLMSDITTMDMQVRTGNEPYREASTADRLEFIRNEWFNTVNTLNEFGINITED
jgi:hypothetical protein